MAFVDIGIGLLSTVVCLAAVALAIRANHDWPAFYRIFLILFFTVWSAVLWLLPRTPSFSTMLLSFVALMGGAVAVGFIPLPPPENRRETKNLLDLIETERTLEQFFRSQGGRLFWPLLAVLIFLVSLRMWMLA